MIDASSTFLTLHTRELTALYDVARAAVRFKDRRDIIDHCLDTVVDRLELDGGCIYLYDDSKGAYECAATRGMRAADLKANDKVCGIPGNYPLAIANTGEALFVADMSTDRRFAVSTRVPRSYVNLPFRSKGVVVGALELISRPNQILTEQQVAILIVVSDQIGIAIENLALLCETEQQTAELYGQVRQLAVLEERNRLAREMHDDLAQALGYLNLKATVSCELLIEGDSESVYQNLLEMKHILREIYIDTRETIFQLRHPASAGEDFIPMLDEHLAEYRKHYGLDAQLEVNEAVVLNLSGEAVVQVTRIIQEAVTNIRKHAHAAHAWVRIEPESDYIKFTIEDDGCGIDPGKMESGGEDRFGIYTMRERAESVGGWIELRSKIGAGTQVILRIPAEGAV